MTVFSISLILAVFFCALVTGFLFAFAVVAMPGLKSLSDAEFVRAFQGMDGIVQSNQPLFVVTWLGSIVSVLASAGLGIFHLGGLDRLLLLAGAVVYIVLVQVPTFRINIPLNNFIQSLDAASMTDDDLEHARQRFEPRWNRWNNVRSLCSCAVVAVLILVLYRL